MNEVNILGKRIKIVPDYRDIVDLIRASIESDRKILMHNINAYIMMLSKRNKDLSLAMEKYSYLFGDGIGMYWGAKVLSGSSLKLHRINGTDLYPHIFRLCAEKSYKIFIWGGTSEAAGIVKEVLHKNYPGINEIKCYSREVKDSDFIMNQINLFRPEVLIVGIGSPDQEIWLSRNFDRLDANLQLCVGSGIDYTAGTLKRAPYLFRKLALEWIYRLLQNPRRLWKRYLIDNICFVYYILKQKYFLNSKGIN